MYIRSDGACGDVDGGSGRRLGGVLGGCSESDTRVMRFHACVMRALLFETTGPELGLVRPRVLNNYELVLVNHGWL